MSFEMIDHVNIAGPPASFEGQDAILKDSQDADMDDLQQIQMIE